MGKENGLGWNPILKTIDASEEWWQKKIKVNADYFATIFFYYI